MKIDVARIDELITGLRDPGSHSACFLEGVVQSDARGVDSLENVRASAAWYGDTKRLATLMQLVFVRTLLKRPVDGEVWAAAALEHMDQLQLLYREFKGLNSPHNLLMRQIEWEKNDPEGVA